MIFYIQIQDFRDTCKLINDNQYFIQLIKILDKKV
jgi:hypothetical protein